jgi:hypothetical protein
MYMLLAADAATCQYRGENCNEGELPFTGMSITQVIMDGLLFLICCLIIRTIKDRSVE